jgi:hypothetical protein
MAQLQSTNVTGVLCVNGVAIGGGKDFKYACFTGSDTFTPSSDLVGGDGALNAIIVGGGGGAGSTAVQGCCYGLGCAMRLEANSSAGGGGAVVTDWFKIDSTDACTVTIGAGGLVNGISWENNLGPSQTPVFTENTTTGGGESTFGGVGAAGGGMGSTSATGRSYFGPGCTNCYSYGFNCPGTRNGGGTTGGGAQCYYYQWCAYRGSPSPQSVGGFGLAGQFAGDNGSQATGSTIFNYFKADQQGNLGSGNNHLGAGGSNAVFGGPSCDRPDVYCNTEGSCNNNVSVTSSMGAPERFYGAGGNGASAFTCLCARAARYTEIQGNPGNPGIVVLTWYE